MVKCVEVTVISQKGNCINNHKVGDKTIIHECGVTGKICIHALYSLLPKAFAMLYGAKFTWLDEDKTITHACPDAKYPVTFKLELKE